MPVLTAFKSRKNTGEAIKRIRKIFLKFQQTAFMAVYFLIYIYAKILLFCVILLFYQPDISILGQNGGIM